MLTEGTNAPIRKKCLYLAGKLVQFHQLQRSNLLCPAAGVPLPILGHNVRLTISSHYQCGGAIWSWSRLLALPNNGDVINQY